MAINLPQLLYDLFMKKGFLPLEELMACGKVNGEILCSETP